MRDDEIAYYRKRLRQERGATVVGEDIAVALAHLKMADEYEKLVKGTKPVRALSPLRPEAGWSGCHSGQDNETQ